MRWHSSDNKVFVLKKIMVVALAAALPVLVPTTAQAMFVSISENNVVIASWTQDDNQAPVDFAADNYVIMTATNIFGAPAGTDAIWYYSANGGGLSFGPDINIIGPQNFTTPANPDVAPVFHVSDYYGVDIGKVSSGVPNTFSVTVPEPATWSMMLVGLGMVGIAVRRRRRVSVTYA